VKREIYDTVIIGAGASGLAAAISARSAGQSVLVCERLGVVAKKVLATGGGKCNLLNDDLGVKFYGRHAAKLVSSVFGLFGKKDILSFFSSIGLFCYSDNGRYFPVTGQASSVVSVLQMAVSRMGVRVEFGCAVRKISRRGETFCVICAGGGEFFGRRVIIAGGGRSYPALGSDGSCYELAARLGHKITEPVPAVVPLVIKDNWCHLFQGQKIDSSVSGFSDGRLISSARGDLLFTAYGLSGTAVLDASTGISVACNRQRRKDVYLEADLVPWMAADDLKAALAERIAGRWAPEQLLVGILPNKIAGVLGRYMSGKSAAYIADAVKHKKFYVSGTRGWNEAEFTAGGISPDDIRARTLESLICPGVYFCGEIIDVVGARGGYNLAWAWASGYIAGKGSG
jgi:hypothetical protein